MENQGIERQKTMLTEAAKIQSALDIAAQAHRKGGVCYDSTKALLCAYRKIKYDRLADKLKETEAAFKEYEYFCEKEEKGETALDDIVAISDQRLLCWNTLQAFINSGDPAAANALTVLVDLSLQLLKKENKAYARLLHVAYIVKKGRSVSSEYIAEELALSRATYYREHDKAIAALSEILFGFLGERHSGCMALF